MKRICVLIMAAVVLALLASAGGVMAQRWGPQGAPPKSDQVARVAVAADITFAHFFLQDPTTSTAWWHSHTIVDGLGGVHLTFYDSNNIYYAHCAMNCGDPANWLELPLFDAGMLDPLDEPTLGVDASGRPRLMWYARYSGDTNYYYAECNANCTDSAANWTSVALGSSNYFLPYPSNVRYAALDTQGRPRLVYRMASDPDYGYGFYYLTCDAGCTTASNWQTTAVTTPDLRPDVLQLVFDSNDRPRVLGYDNNNEGLVYAECNSSCSTAANWGSVGLFAPIYCGLFDCGFVLRVDAQGRPRIAYYEGNVSHNVLYYAWSNASPLTAGGWLSYTLNYPTNSDAWSLDLALDSQGRPSVAFATDELDLSYVTCTTNCETASPTWQQQFIETGDDLDVSYPIPTNPGCLSSTWMVIGYPSLALDAADNPNVSYYVRHGQLCQDWQGHWQILYDAKSIRFARPGSTGPTIPTAPSGVTISGPPTGTIDILYTFTAMISPITATIPITYVWQATGQAAQTHTGGGASDTASFTWPAGATGVKTIAVTASNAAGSAGKSRDIIIYATPIYYDHWVYLPVVLK